MIATPIKNCYQKKNQNNKSSTSTVLQEGTTSGSPKIEASTPPTPLPRSKSKPEFQLNISNNNNVTEEDANAVIAKPKILKELNNNTEGNMAENDSWFIPVTPATKRCKSTVQHTPITERTCNEKTRHNSGPSEMNKIQLFNNNTPPKTVGHSGDTDLNTSNPMAGMSLWEQHESRPVLKHQT